MIKMILIYAVLFLVFFSGIYGVKMLSKSTSSEKKDVLKIAVYSALSAVLTFISIVIIVLIF